MSEGFDTSVRVGLLDPLRVGATVAGLARWGPSLASFYAAAALRHPRRPAVIDEHASISFAALDRRSTALAKGLRSLGLRAPASIGIMCRNHRHFVEVSAAVAKAGLVPVYLNTGFGGPQLGDVVEREAVAGLMCDEAFLPIVEPLDFQGPVVVADGGQGQTLRDVRARAGRMPLPPSRPIAPVLLTSGTTGTPKGARRSANVDARSAVGMFERIPYRVGDVFALPTPLFHAWGLAQLTVAATLGSTVVVSRAFDRDQVIDMVADHRASVLAVVPVMLQRLLAGDLDTAGLSTLRITASSGSALQAAVATEWMDRVGDNLYNMYGSTEVGQATIATPEDLRTAPGTAGRPVPGTSVRILDDTDADVPDGTVGRIFVGSGAQFTGYTGGGGKKIVHGLMSSGDVGFFDDDGRLFVTGRDDDMIVSGGENVFPLEVEDALLSHPDVEQAAVVGVSDEEFGQRLAAYVVPVGDAQPDPDELRRYVGEQLARHKVPREVELVAEIPRTTTGKILRGQLG